MVITKNNNSCKIHYCLCSEIFQMKYRAHIWLGFCFFLSIISSGFCLQKEIIVRVKSEAVAKGKTSIISYFQQGKDITAAKSLFTDRATRKKTGGNSTGFLNSFFVISLSDGVDINRYIKEFTNSNYVDYAVPNRIYNLCQNGEDPLFEYQWGMHKIAIEEAWKETEGRKEVIVGLIDSGIEYSHPDLRDNIWINRGEDINGDGLFTEEDNNGIDDDGNGYIDDVAGWDFTDAPSFPDNGDYYGEDNSPDDEAGHGTSMAGIIGAVRNNGIGIVGVAPNISIMNLRAATERGLLEEDDVARAIVYAVPIPRHWLLGGARG